MKILRRFLEWLRSAFNLPGGKLGIGILAAAGIAVGVISLGGFNSFVGYTDSLEFCTSCHAMKEYIYPGYSESSHAINPSGVRAVCADCHVPDAFVPKMLAKTRATVNELPRHLFRSIHAEEDYRARREVLIHRVWDRMRATDSRECRSCHEWDQMALEEQRTAARREHEDGRAEGKSCIDCHQGIVHELPAGMLEEEVEEEIDWGFGGSR